MSDETGLVLSSDFDAMLARRDAQVAACRVVDKMLAEQPEGFPRLFFKDGSEWNVDKAIREAERCAWAELVTGTGLYTFMDATARREWNEHLERGALLPFTAENAKLFAVGLHEQRGAMVKRGVGDCFRRLSGHYVTNKPDRFGVRMILTRVLSTYGNGRGAWWSVNSRACDDLDDLGEPDHRRGAWHVMHEARADAESGPWPRVIAFEYFDVKLHKNGNGHLTFRHEADVQRLNKVLSLETDGKTLAPATREKRRAPPPTPDVGGELAYFATPPELARELVGCCGVTPSCLVLEPSAGEGAIAQAIVEAQGSRSRLQCVEIHPGRALTCERATGAYVDVADFMTWRPSGGQQFDRIVMNPPFSLPGQPLADVDHVRHAWGMLAKGGRLVAVMNAGVKFRSDAKAVEFRYWLETMGGTIEDLPDGSFAASGTNVRAVVVTVDAQ